MSRVEKLRARLNAFEREDKPAFERWKAREFGTMLSRAREIEAKVRERQLLIDDVQNEIRRSYCDVQTAYRRVMQRRANPACTADEFRVPPKPERKEPPDFAANLSGFEQELIFQHWLREYFGINPDRMPDEAYDKTFGTFRFHMFGGEAPPEPEPDSLTSLSPETKPPPAATLKEMYRVLVRRLHPDVRANGNGHASALWHEVQIAYAARDGERLETLLALSEIETGELGSKTTLFQMRAVWRELKQALRALRRSLRAALADDAWGFARRGGDEALRIRVAKTLEHDLAKQKRTLDYLNATVAGWSVPAHLIVHEPVADQEPQLI